MNYYAEQVRKITKELYSKDYLTQQIVQAKHFIDSHLSEKILLGDIAAKANMSKFHFLRIFRSLYGITPNQYLTEVRITRSKELLRSGSSVSEVCASVGFDSTTSFAGLFKKNTGSSPSAFLKKQTKKAISESRNSRSFQIFVPQQTITSFL